MAKRESDASANAERGEMELVLGGQAFVLRPSFEAISAFEQATGKGLIDLTEAALARRLTLSEAAQIASECIRAWGRAVENVSARGVSTARVAELMLEAEGGFQVALTTVAGMLALASTGGFTAKGEAKAVGTTKTPDAVPAAA